MADGGFIGLSSETLGHDFLTGKMDDLTTRVCPEVRPATSRLNPFYRMLARVETANPEELEIFADM